MIDPLRYLLNRLPWRLMRKSGIAYDRDGLVTVHNAEFQADERFARAYLAGRATGSWGGADIQWRAHVAIWAANLASHLPGDFVECGVNRGGLSRAIVDYLNWNALGKTFYLLDTFGGFDSRWPAANTKEWQYDDSYSAVRRTFAAFDRIEIIKGTVPDTLAKVTASAIAYLHIDMNSVVPEREAVAWFWPRLVKGGVLLLDDYGWSGHEAQKQAQDEFASANGFTILSLPTGQGLAIKT